MQFIWISSFSSHKWKTNLPPPLPILTLNFPLSSDFHSSAHSYKHSSSIVERCCPFLFLKHIALRILQHTYWTFIAYYFVFVFYNSLNFKRTRTMYILLTFVYPALGTEPAILWPHSVYCVNNSGMNDLGWRGNTYTIYLPSSWDTYYVSITMLNTRGGAASTTDKSPCLHGAPILVCEGRQVNK